MEAGQLLNAGKLFKEVAVTKELASWVSQARLPRHGTLNCAELITAHKVNL